MRRFPVAISVPHGGSRVPPAVADLCALSPNDVLATSEPLAASLFGPLIDHAEVFASIAIARIFVDVDRCEHDRTPDGVIKTHTSAGQPIYHSSLSDEHIEGLLSRYYRPFREGLERRAQQAVLGLNCHAVYTDPQEALQTIATVDPTFPISWLRRFNRSLRGAFITRTCVRPRTLGGHIFRCWPGDIPWMDLEVRLAHSSQLDAASNALLEGLGTFCHHPLRQ